MERFEWKDANSILAMEVPNNEAEDFMCWKGSCNGKYKVRSGYNFFQSNLDSDNRKIYDHDVKIPPKWKVFLWKLIYDGIAVKDNLMKRGMEGNVECDYCGGGKEDSSHLFRFCSVAILAWSVCALDIDATKNSSYSLKNG